MNQNSYINEVFEEWVRFIDCGGQMGGLSSSVIGKLMDGKTGQGGFGPSLMGADCIGLKVEMAVCALAQNNRMCADALRKEYLGVLIDPRGSTATQHKKALQLGISLRTYKRYLKQGREFVRTRIQNQNNDDRR